MPRKPRERNEAAPPAPRRLRLAVTGGHTLVAQGILRTLDRLPGLDRVLVFDVLPPDVCDPRIEFHQADLTRPGVEAEMAGILADRQVDVFLHAAFLWDAVRDATWAHELESVGTDYVLAAVLAGGVKRLVVTSSGRMYGVSHRLPVPIPEGAPLDADRTVPPFRDKVAAERAVARFAAAHPEICTTVLRSVWALGDGVDRLIPRTLRRRMVPVMAGFDPLVQFLHPDDLMDAYHAVLAADRPGIFNVAPPDALPWSRILCIGERVPLPVPHALALHAFRLLWNTGIGDVHPAYLNYLRFPVVLDGSKARQVLGIRPRSVAETVEGFFRAVGDGEGDDGAAG